MAASIVGLIVGAVLLAWAVVATVWAVEQERKVRGLAEELQRPQLAPEPMPEPAWARALRDQQRMEQPLLSEEVTAKLIERLLDAALPARQVEQDEEEQTRSSAEYEPPPEDVPRDWTDPFFAIDRPLVAGLSPGQGIPGIGQDVEEWGGDETQAYVEDMQEQATRDEIREVGEEMFDAWDADRGGMPR